MACFPNQIRDISRIVITVHFTKGTLRNVSVVKDLGRMSEVLSLRTQVWMAEDLARLEKRELSFCF